MRAARRTWGSVATVVAVLSGVALAPPPASAQGSGAAQAAQPTVTVDPADDLVDGTRVTITVAGLEPEIWVDAAQCAAAAQALYGDCDTSDIAYGITDDTGSATLSLRVDAILDTADGDAPIGPTAACTPASSASAPMRAGPLRPRLRCTSWPTGRSRRRLRSR
jgi:hypothetical protein